MIYTSADKRKLAEIDLTDNHLLASNALEGLLSQLPQHINPNALVIPVLDNHSDVLRNEYVLDREKKVLSSDYGEYYDISTPFKLAELINSFDLVLDWGLIEECLYEGWFCPCCGRYLGEDKHDSCDECLNEVNSVDLI